MCDRGPAVERARQGVRTERARRGTSEAAWGKSPGCGSAWGARPAGGGQAALGPQGRPPVWANTSAPRPEPRSPCGADPGLPPTPGGGAGLCRCRERHLQSEKLGRRLAPPPAARHVTFAGCPWLPFTIFTFCSFWVVCLFKGRLNNPTQHPATRKQNES